MANLIKLRKGLDINLEGKAQERWMPLADTGMYSLCPDDFTGVTPKMAVKVQEHVKAGSVLFYDKQHPELKIVSPVSGTVTDIVRGERRKVMNIVIQASDKQEYEDFGMQEADTMHADDVKELLLRSGLFAFLRQRPYDVVADPTVTPRAIFVSAFDSHPLAPDFEFVLKGEEKTFQAGIDALARMAPVFLGVSAKQHALTQVAHATVTVFEGPHPAGNVGVQINHLAPVKKGETVWTADAQTVLFIGRLFQEGKADLTRGVAVTGSEVLHTGYCRMKVGAQLTPALQMNVTEGKDLRFISGNPLTGKRVERNGHLGAFHHQLTVIPEGDEVHELLGWIRPRLNDFSVSRSYFSWLLGKKRQYVLDARVKGGERHMIMSGEYEKVFPMDILPEYLIKAILAGDIDRMEELGIYEVAPEDFALCEFVCSSKMELQRIVREGLDMLRAEMS